jgi:hypothetical protein
MGWTGVLIVLGLFGLTLLISWGLGSLYRKTQEDRKGGQ